MTITLRQIDAFRSVMTCGSLTGAANQLGISQPAISRLIADLEADIGYHLFERVGRRITPTVEANILIDEVKRALIGMMQIRETALEIGRFRHARLRILTVPGIPATLMTTLIRRFAQGHPEVFISVDVKPDDLVVECLTSHQCDLAIVTALPDNRDFITQRLSSFPVRCMLPPGHALARKDLITPEDLAGQVFVSYRPDDSLRAAIDALFESSKVTRILRYEASTPDLLRCMVASGMGVALASLVETGEVQDDFNVTLMPFAPALSFDVKAIWSRHRQLSALAQAFVSSSENWLRTRSAMT